MLGWKLFMRALTLLIENLGDALRVSALPYIVLIVASVLLVGSDSTPMLADPLGTDELTPAELQTAIVPSMGDLLIALLSLVVSLWIAVAWHRYVLLQEQTPGWLPAMHSGAMLGYFGRSVLIGLLVVMVVVAVAVPAGLILAVLLPESLAGPLIGAVALFAAMILFYRLAVVLPARAVERNMTFSEAMAATKGHSGTVVVLALLTVGFSFLLQLPTVIGGSQGIVTVIYQGVVGWIGLMIGVSTLTALYGHLVEGRPVE